VGQLVPVALVQPVRVVLVSQVDQLVPVALVQQVRVVLASPVDQLVPVALVQQVRVVLASPVDQLVPAALESQAAHAARAVPAGNHLAQARSAHGISTLNSCVAAFHHECGNSIFGSRHTAGSAQR
jgi:hypothetical protein